MTHLEKYEYLRQQKAKNVNSGDYTIAMHCTYYSLIQYVHYLLIEKFLSFDSHKEIESHIYEYPGDEKGYHNGLINLLRKEINVRDRNFSKKFSKLKDSRIKADYSNYKLTKQEIETAEDLLEKLITKIEK